MKIMNYVLLLFSFGLLSHCDAQSAMNVSNENITGSDQKAIKQIVQQFVKGGDTNDVKTLGNTLHDQFRVLFSDAKKGSLDVLDRATYLDLIGKKVFGGKPRSLKIESLDINGGINATVKVLLESKEAIFHNYLSLVKMDGQWLITQDFLYVDAKG